MNPLALLSLLGTAGRVLSPGSDRSLSTSDVAGLDFEQLLDRARDGAVESGRNVVLGAGANVELSSDQLERISQAADRAEAAGADGAIILIDGMALQLDVEARQIVGVIDPNAPTTLSGVDAVVTAPPSGAQRGSPLPLPSPGMHPALTEILAAGEQG